MFWKKYSKAPIHQIYPEILNWEIGDELNLLGFYSRFPTKASYQGFDSTFIFVREISTNAIIKIPATGIRVNNVSAAQRKRAAELVAARTYMESIKVGTL